MMASDGLTTDHLRLAFRQLVLQLPDSAWATGDGAQRKQQALARGDPQGNFHEPELYTGLNVVILEDTCYLKDAFWNTANPNFNQPDVINYQKIGANLSFSAVQPFLGLSNGMDDGWCSDWAGTSYGGIGVFGFEPNRISHISLFDRFGTDDALSQVIRALEADALGRSIPAINMLQPVTQTTPGYQATALLLANAPIIISDGGNPDWVTYVFREFANVFLEQVRSRVYAGTAIYMGKSAGSMVVSANYGLTMEGMLLPSLLLRNDTRGLGFVPNCAFRPHWTPSWSYLSATYASLTGLQVVQISNGGGMQCLNGTCSLIGAPTNGTLVAGGGSSPNYTRLAEAVRAVVDGIPNTTPAPLPGSPNSGFPVGVALGSGALGIVLGAFLAAIAITLYHRKGQSRGRDHEARSAELSPIRLP